MPALKRFLSEYGFLTTLAVAFVLIGSLPYGYGYLHARDDMRFMGFVGRGVFGQNGYMMLARQAQHGRCLFENLMTPEPVPRVFFNAEWWLFGAMARWTGLPLPAVFHLWRAVTVFLLVFSAGYLARLCLATAFQRKLAVALITLGSGFGWILWTASKTILFLFPAARYLAKDQVVSGVHLTGFLFPLSLDVTGVSIPAYLINQPHFLRATAFAILTCAFLLAGERSGRRVHFVLAGLAALAHAAIRPYNIPESYGIFLFYPVLLSIRERRVAWTRVIQYLIPGVMLFPMVVYYAYLARVNALGSPGPLWRPGLFVDHILWLGLPFLLVFLFFPGVIYLRHARSSSVLLALWILLAFLIEQAYPFYTSGQEAAFSAYMVVPALLATAGPLRYLYRAACRNGFLRRRSPVDVSSPAFKRGAAVALVIFCMPSFAIAYAGMFTGLRDYPAPHYLSKDTHQALLWLGEHAGPHDTVLSSFETGQLVPRVSGVKVFLGHYMLTNNYAEKQALVNRFYGTRDDDAFKRGLAAAYGIHYVILGTQERRPNGMDPAEHSWLAPCYSRGDATLFEVRLNDGRG
jgi:hypothetical protein